MLIKTPNFNFHVFSCCVDASKKDKHRTINGSSQNFRLHNWLCNSQRLRNSWLLYQRSIKRNQLNRTWKLNNYKPIFSLFNICSVLFEYKNICEGDPKSNFVLKIKKFIIHILKLQLFSIFLHSYETHSTTCHIFEQLLRCVQIYHL